MVPKLQQNCVCKSNLRAYDALTTEDFGQCRLTKWQSKSYPAVHSFTIPASNSSVMYILFDTYACQCLCIIRPYAAPCCRIAAGGDARFRQSRLGAGDSFKEDDDAYEKEDFAGFDKPTRIEGEEGGGHVDPDPGDRDSVSISDRQPHASLHLSVLFATKSDTYLLQHCHST